MDMVLLRIILCMHPANERRRYIVMPSLIGWVHTQNDPCIPACKFSLTKYLHNVDAYWLKCRLGMLKGSMTIKIVTTAMGSLFVMEGTQLNFMFNPFKELLNELYSNIALWNKALCHMWCKMECLYPVQYESSTSTDKSSSYQHHYKMERNTIILSSAT